MQILMIDFHYYRFPEHLSTIESFMQYITERYNSFIPMIQYQTDNCVFPYLIEEDAKTVYVNVAKMREICVEEATILNRETYDSRLKRVIQQKCVDCIHYKEDLEGDNAQGHRERLSLDGECWGYEKKAD